MTKAELINEIAKQGDISKNDADFALTTVIETISNMLARGEKIQLVGFGTFEVRDKKPREALNPKTKEKISVPAKKAPAFRAGKALKDFINR